MLDPFLYVWTRHRRGDHHCVCHPPALSPPSRAAAAVAAAVAVPGLFQLVVLSQTADVGNTETN
jgi:hypothetical protein